MTTTRQDNANRLTHLGHVALIHHMRAEGIHPNKITDQFTAAGLMSEIRQQGHTWLSMNSISGHGPTRAHALVNWLNVATGLAAGQIAVEGTISGARLQ